MKEKEAAETITFGEQEFPDPKDVSANQVYNC